MVCARPRPVPNLRLRRQELARGAMSQDLEHVVERLMQTFKTATGRMVSMHPEKAFVNVLLQSQALQSWKRSGAGSGRAYMELIRDPGLSRMQGRNYDRVDEEGKVLFQGRGHPLPEGALKKAAIKSVKQVRLLQCCRNVSCRRLCTQPLVLPEQGANVVDSLAAGKPH